MTKELPLYVCHKKVRALEIRSIGPYAPEASGKLKREIIFADPDFRPIWVDGAMFSRTAPLPGDYYVVYEDGYASFSPRKAFLEGYQLESGLDTLMAQLQGLSEMRHSLDDGIPTVARVAREAYVTINSLKQQIETLKADVVATRQMAGFKEVKREKADPDQP